MLIITNKHPKVGVQKCTIGLYGVKIQKSEILEQEKSRLRDKPYLKKKKKKKKLAGMIGHKKSFTWVKKTPGKISIVFEDL